MVAGDEALSGATDIFAAAQGVGQVVRSMSRRRLFEAGHCVALVAGLLHFEEPMIASV
jgi:hypothetical protein